MKQPFGFGSGPLRFASGVFEDLGFSCLPRLGRFLASLLFTLALLALLAQFLVYVHYSVSLFRFPFDYDQGEGFELYDTVLQSQGRWPYQDSQIFPFYTSIYPPLFHIITVPLVWLFGPKLWTGRLVGFTASLIAAGAIGWGVHRASGNRVIAVLSGLTFLASNYTFHIGPLFRQHMTMVMFETLAIVTLAQAPIPGHLPPELGGSPVGENTDRGRVFPPLFALFANGGGWGWGLFFLLCAGYTKQLALATVLAGLGYLFLRGPKRALLAGLGLAVIASGLFLYINLATHGWWYTSIIRANINAYDVNQALSLYKQWFSLHLVIALIALARLIYETYFARLSAYSVWFLFALANGLLSGKFGAGESYFVTTTTAACVLAGIAMAKLWGWAMKAEVSQLRLGDARRRTPLAVAVALAIPLLYLWQTRLTLHTYTEGPIYGPIARMLGVTGQRGYYDSQGYTQLGPRPTQADHEGGYAIAELARHAPGPVFSEEAGFMFVAGKPVVTNAFPQLVMYQAGLFDPTQEIEMINQKAFGLVIFRAQFYPPPVLQAIGANYQPMTEIQMNGFLYRILEPRP